jgi:hypothetical protein
MIYKKLLDQVIKIHFPKANYDLKGKLEWFPVTDQQKKRYFKKRGKELKIQRRRYKTNEVYWEKVKNEKKVSSPYFFYHHILISEIEKNGIFYCISDYCIGRMGHKMRYKFKLVNLSDLTSYNNLKIELLNENMIMIR